MAAIIGKEFNLNGEDPLNSMMNAASAGVFSFFINAANSLSAKIGIDAELTREYQAKTSKTIVGQEVSFGSGIFIDPRSVTISEMDFKQELDVSVENSASIRVNKGPK